MENISHLLKSTQLELENNPIGFEGLTIKFMQTLNKAQTDSVEVIPMLVESYRHDEHIKSIFSFNILRVITIYNFPQLNTNELYTLICLIYGERLSSLSKQISFTRIIEGFLLTKIMMKLLERSRSIIPEYFSWFQTSIQFLLTELRSNNQIKSKNNYHSIENQVEKCLTIYYDKINRYAILEVIRLVMMQFRSIISINQKQYFLNSKIYQTTQNIFNQILTSINLKNAVENRIHQSIKDCLLLENVTNEPIYLQKPQEFIQLTPRIITEQPNMKIKLLKRKRNKLAKKIQSELRSNLHSRLQQEKVLSEVKTNRIKRIHKKQEFILQKQTQEGKKYAKALKKQKQIRKNKETKVGKQKGKKK